MHVGEIGASGRWDGHWRDLPGWPPPQLQDQAWHLHGDGTLSTGPADRAAVSSFRYDPADPTPSAGGPRLDARPARPHRNNTLEARADVLVFTSAPLREPLEVIGPVSTRLRARGSRPYFDVFARLCDVDPRGGSWDLCDGLVRLGGPGAHLTPVPAPATATDTASAPDPAAEPGPRPWSDVTVPMSATAHRFGAGHRLRVQVSGGAHPRFFRNTGTGEPLATATGLVPVDIEIAHGPDHPAVLSLPVT